MVAASHNPQGKKARRLKPGQRLRIALKERDLSIRGLAALVGCDHQLVLSWLRSRGRPGFDYRNRLAEVLIEIPASLWATPREAGVERRIAAARAAAKAEARKTFKGKDARTVKRRARKLAA